jgi:hypothetical protein
MGAGTAQLQYTETIRRSPTDGNDNGPLGFPHAVYCCSLIPTSDFHLNQQSQSGYC